MCTRVGGVETRTGVLGQVCQNKRADVKDERYDKLGYSENTTIQILLEKSLPIFLHKNCALRSIQTSNPNLVGLLG